MQGQRRDDSCVSALASSAVRRASFAAREAEFTAVAAAGGDRVPERTLETDREREREREREGGGGVMEGGRCLLAGNCPSGGARTAGGRAILRAMQLAAGSWLSPAFEGTSDQSLHVGTRLGGPAMGPHSQWQPALAAA